MAKNYSRRIALLVAAFAVMGSIADAQTPSPSSLGITNVAGSSGVSLTVNDPYNYTWSVLASTNLTTWSEVSRLKVFNGNFQTNLTNDPSVKSVMYRTMYN